MWLRTQLQKEQLFNNFDAIRGEFGKNTCGKMSKALSSVQTKHVKEQVFFIFVATLKSSMREFMET